MNKNKKAWIRIVEATMGVMLVASVLFVMVARAPKNTENNIYETQHFILEQVSKNDSLRRLILTYDEAAPDPIIENQVNGMIRGMMPAYLEFSSRICKVDDVCGMYNYPAGIERKDIYADEILITSTLSQYNPKKVRLFVWGK
ncbi:hypothetical protein A3K73_07400 [Candidatus Pacearchaeota archaeon RBG_13_36_9]|nr:MAG: hypothetical protein A3K73_07400 [Candidatus Pacearchaeota archaeon RBG_13_36_9]